MPFKPLKDTKAELAAIIAEDKGLVHLVEFMGAFLKVKMSTNLELVNDIACYLFESHEANLLNKCTRIIMNESDIMLMMGDILKYINTKKEK